MWKPCLLAIIVFFTAKNINANDIKFPPELLWWINEVNKINKNVKIENFQYAGKETMNFGVEDIHKGALIYPVFMRWNYSGNTVGYFNHNGTSPRKQRSGKYSIGGDFDDLGILYIADKNKNIFFADFFGIRSGLNAIYWLTDTILIGVGLFVNDEAIDLFIFSYKVDTINKTVERTDYCFDNAFKNSDRSLIKLDWYEHRTDYFEIPR
jgi:hypothetical protein